MNKYIVFVFTLLLTVSCTDTAITDPFDNKTIDNSKIFLTPEEYISIAYDNPKEISQEDIIQIVSDFNDIRSDVENNTSTRSFSLLKINIKNKYYISNNNEKQISTRTKANDELKIPILEVELTQDNGENDFTVLCADERAPKVLFYAKNYNSSSEMNDETRYLLELSKNSILSDITEVERLKVEKRDSTIHKIAKAFNITKDKVSYSSIKERIAVTDKILTRMNPAGGVGKPTTSVVAYVNPLSKVMWSQQYPYNIAMPKKMIFDGNAGEYYDNVLVGCANIAIGTLLTIIKPNMLYDENKDVDWSYVTSITHLYINTYYPEKSSPPELIEMITKLLAMIAEKNGSKSSYETKKIIGDDKVETTKEVITGTETTIPNTINFIRDVASFSGDERTVFNANNAKLSLFNKKPVFLFGIGHLQYEDGTEINPNYRPGHAWLIDGYIMTKRSGQAVYDNYWSVNMGWGTQLSKGYFRTGDNFQECDVRFKNGKNHAVYYTNEQWMLYNIAKK